jgi:hypothetical protein
MTDISEACSGDLPSDDHELVKTQKTAQEPTLDQDDELSTPERDSEDALAAREGKAQAAEDKAIQTALDYATRP